MIRFTIKITGHIWWGAWVVSGLMLAWILYFVFNLIGVRRADQQGAITSSRAKARSSS